MAESEICLNLTLGERGIRPLLNFSDFSDLNLSSSALDACSWSPDLVLITFEDISIISKKNEITKSYFLLYQHLHLPGLGVETKRGACPSSFHQVVTFR